MICEKCGRDKPSTYEVSPPLTSENQVVCRACYRQLDAEHNWWAVQVKVVELLCQKNFSAALEQLQSDTVKRLRLYRHIDREALSYEADLLESMDSHDEALAIYYRLLKMRSGTAYGRIMDRFCLVEALCKSGRLDDVVSLVAGTLRFAMAHNEDGVLLTVLLQCCRLAALTPNGGKKPKAIYLRALERTMRFWGVQSSADDAKDWESFWDAVEKTSTSAAKDGMMRPSMIQQRLEYEQRLESGDTDYTGRRQ